MIIDGILGGRQDAYHNADLIEYVSDFVAAKGEISSQKVEAIANLYGATIKRNGYVLHDLGDLDLGRNGRDLEVILAVALAICHPECKIGLTRSARDGNVDIVIEQEEEISLLDTKDSLDTDRYFLEDVFYEFKNHNWSLYKIPRRKHAGERLESTHNVKVIGLRNVIVNMCNTALNDIHPSMVDDRICMIAKHLSEIERS